MISRSLNADVKRIAHTILPSLETVFLESRSHVERHMATTIFPDFVKHQLIQCTATTLSLRSPSVASSKSEYPGLGESFCIVKPSGTVVTAVSDAFLRITGYPLEETVNRGCPLLQGLLTKAILGEGREVNGLLLNSRKESWNLCFLYPLRDQKGRLQFWLGAQVDVSGSVKDRDGLLRVLDATSYTDLGSDGSSFSKSEDSSRKGSTAETKLDRDGSIHSRESSRISTSRSRFLQQFRRPPPRPCSASLPESPDYIISPAEHQPPRNNILSAQRFHPRTSHIPTFPTTYSYHILLKCSSSHSPLSRHREPTPTGTRKKKSLKLHALSYSDEAAELLSIRGDISQLDIFRVLEDKSHSPSITKSFKSMVRERIVCGRSIRAEMIVDTNYMFNARLKAGVGIGRPVSADLDGKFEKKLAKSPKQEKLVGHWTPMRNIDGNIDLVILVLTPPLM